MPHADNPIFFDAKTFTGEKLPKVMRDRDHFICWSKIPFESRGKDGKPKMNKPKTPLSAATGRLAIGGGNNAEKDQRDLATAISMARKKDLGVGYYMRADGNQTFLDLDGCAEVLPDGSLVLSDRAKEILALFSDTYWELSPSHTGLHGFVTGDLPKTIDKTVLGWLEGYSFGRYATMTGEALPGFPAVLADGQKRLDELYEKYVTGKEKQEKATKEQVKKSKSAQKSRFEWPEGKIYEGKDAPDGAASGRNGWFTRYSGVLRHKSTSKESALISLQKQNEERCVPPLEDSELQSILNSVYALYAAGGGPTFENLPEGLLATWYNPETEESETRRIGNQLTGIERARDGQGNGWSLLVEFTNDEGGTKQLLLQAKDFHSTGRLTQQKLSEAGYHAPLGHQTIENKMLLLYLDGMSKLPFSRRADRPGWDAEHLTFTTSREIIGSDERLCYEGPDLFKQAGSYDIWHWNVSVPMAGNSLGVFWMSAAFTSPILPWLNLSGNPAFLAYGDSTLGKSKCNEVAASVWGDPDVDRGESYLRTCKTTGNGLEALFAQSNDCGTILDDLKELSGDDVESVIFMATNGKGKQRLTAEAKARKTATWSGVTLITSEISSAVKAAEGYKGKNKVVHAGSEVRMPNIFVKEFVTEAGVKQGLFETLWGEKTSFEFVEAVSASAKGNYGWAGPMFVRSFMANRAEEIKFADEVLKRVTEDITQLIPAGNRQAGRVAEKFAALAAGGELATRFGLTGWPLGEAEDAALRCFQWWFSNWPGAARGFGNSEIVTHAKRMIQQKSAQFEGAWEPYSVDGATHYRNPKIRDRLGYLLTDHPTGRIVYHMEAATFDDYFKLYGNRSTVAAALFNAGMLMAPKGQDPKHPYQSRRMPLGEGASRCWGFSIAMPVDGTEEPMQDEAPEPF